DAAQSRCRSNVRRDIPPRQGDPGAPPIECACDPQLRDTGLLQRAAKLRDVLHLAGRDLELNHLAALREHETGGVEDLTTRCRRLTSRQLLAFGASAPCLPLK